MLHFYDGVIRSYLLQTMRALSNFTVKYGDGTLVRVPVTYGDLDKQTASIIKNNSENFIVTVPRISITINELSLERDRLADSTFISKVNIRERAITTDPQTERDTYQQFQGRNYTVERLMPTPYKLVMKADIWSANTDQKLQILEQMLVLFNPSLEIQTNDNYVDWTSLSVLNLTDVHWSSKTANSGDGLSVDIATLTLDTPIWISPPVKVKHLGVITSIITSVYENVDKSWTNIDGLGYDFTGGTTSLTELLYKDKITITNYKIQVYNGQAMLLAKNEQAIPGTTSFDPTIKTGIAINWAEVFEKYPGRHVDGATKIFLLQEDNTEVMGTAAISPIDPSILIINWDKDTYPKNYGIDSQGRIQNIDLDYNGANSNRPNSPGTFDAVIDPLTKGPRGSGLPDPFLGMRYLMVQDIGNINNQSGAEAWRGLDNSDLVAHADDIIEWDGNKWVVIFNSNIMNNVLLYQTNTYSNIQFMWNGIAWVKSFERDYDVGEWRIEL